MATLISDTSPTWEEEVQAVTLNEVMAAAVLL